MAVEWQRWYRLLLYTLAYITVMMFLSLSLTMIIGFGYLSRQDGSLQGESKCYANSTSDSPISPMHRSAAQLEELNAVNVSERFKILLRTGFYISLVYTLLWILFYTPCIQDNKIIKKIGFWTLFGASLVYLGHFTTANVFRFEHSGRVCSGDFGWDPKHPHDLPPIPPKP